jgi:subtilisin family serine protease
MVRKSWNLVVLLGAVLALSAASASAQNVYDYILQSPNDATAQAACQTYGMTLVSVIREPGTYLVQVSAAVPSNVLQQWVQHDRNVSHLELDNKVSAPQSSLTIPPYIPPMPVTNYVTDAHLIKLYGSAAWIGYIQQPAVYATNDSTATQQNASGTITVAVIDTGIDPNNPILAPVLVSGYDFTRNLPGYASDLADIDQHTAAMVDQPGSSAGSNYQVVVVNQFAAAILDQHTAAMVDGNGLPSDFGHGTMVAGLIHLTAPAANIMSLKAFAADGTGSESDIIRAIYYAVDNGATVINMSFEMPQISDALMKAINYADRHRVICVASAGNDGQSSLVYPAAYGNVIGVGSVDQQNNPSSFSNFGPDLVRLSAPGEALVTTYPGNHYAAVWGTSFSAALVSGSVADLFLAVDPHIARQLRFGDFERSLSHAKTCGNGNAMGAGCLDYNQALQFIKGTNFPH